MSAPAATASTRTAGSVGTVEIVVGAAVRDHGKLCSWHRHRSNPPDRPELAEAIQPNGRIGVMLKLRASGRLIKPAPVPSPRWPGILRMRRSSSARSIRKRSA